MTVPRGPGHVLLDIGGARGAAIIFTCRELCGAEVEIREVRSAWDGTHVGVQERQVAGGPCWAAVFGPLWEGDYEARLKGRAVKQVLSFRVKGGKVALTRWPSP